MTQPNSMMKKRKINIGAGTAWYAEGWEVLDNAPGQYKEPWKRRGKCWDSGLPSDTYDIVFSSHMLEHIPHLRMEKTIAEFNRILKIGGTLRILVPSLRKAAEAYVKNDVGFFSGSKHYSDHMGIGASFVRVLISPGSQTLAISREMDEIFGGYAHLYSYDFEMLRTVLEKWGFGRIVESEPGQSSIEELGDFQHIVYEGKRYAMDDPFVREKRHKQSGVGWHMSGFDKTSSRQLVVEATKVESVVYELKKEYKFHQSGRLDSPVDQIKLTLIRWISRSIDGIYSFANMLRIPSVLRWLVKISR